MMIFNYPIIVHMHYQHMDDGRIALTLVADCLGLDYVRYSYYYYFWREPGWRLLVT